MIVEFFFAAGFGGSLATIFEIVVAFVSIPWIELITLILFKSSSSERIVVSFSDWTGVVGSPGSPRPPRKPPDKFSQSKLLKSCSPVDC